MIFRRFFFSSPSPSASRGSGQPPDLALKAEDAQPPRGDGAPLSLRARVMAVRVSVLPRGSRPPLVSPNRRLHLVRGDTVLDFILAILPPNAEACLPTVFLAGAECPLSESVAIFRDGEEIVMEWTQQPQPQPELQPQPISISTPQPQLLAQPQPQLQSQPQQTQPPLQHFQPPPVPPPPAPPFVAPTAQRPARPLGRSIAHAAFASSLKPADAVAEAGPKASRKRARADESGGGGAVAAAVSSAAAVVPRAPEDVPSLRKRARRGVRAGKKHRKRRDLAADGAGHVAAEVAAAGSDAVVRVDDAGSAAAAAFAANGGGAEVVAEEVGAVDDFLLLIEAGFGKRGGAPAAESMDYQVLVQAPAIEPAVASTASEFALSSAPLGPSAQTNSAATLPDGPAIPAPAHVADARRSRVSRSFGLGGVMRALTAGNM